MDWGIGFIWQIFQGVVYYVRKPNISDKYFWQIFQGVVYNASKPIWRRRRGKSDVRLGSAAAGLSYIKAWCPHQHCLFFYVASHIYLHTYKSTMHMQTYPEEYIYNIYASKRYECVHAIYDISSSNNFCSSCVYLARTSYCWLQLKYTYVHQTHLCVFS